MTQLSCETRRIGLMADSHGNLSAMLKCIERFNACEVDTIIHLGDFFDSQYSEEIVWILETIRRHKILTVKGNNDYQVEQSMGNGCSRHIPENQRKKIQSFLSTVPMRRFIFNICFAHSLPYDSIRAFYEPIDTGNTDRAEQVFRNTSYQIIFSGHSHFPVLFRFRSGKVSRESINLKNPTRLHKNERFIVIVGSASEGESGLIDIEQMEYERIRI